MHTFECFRAEESQQINEKATRWNTTPKPMPNETRSAENRIQHKIERMRVYEQRYENERRRERAGDECVI